MKRQPVDRVVRDLAGTGQTQVDWPPLTEALKERLHIVGDYTGWYNKYDERILQALDIDTRRVGELFSPESPLTRTVGSRRYNCWGIGYEFTGQYWEIVENPLRGATLDDLESYPFPDASRIDQKRIDDWAERARRLYENTDYVVVAEHPCFGVFEIGCWTVGFDEYLYKCAAEPEFVHRFSEKVLHYQKEVIERYYSALGPYIHLTTSGDDFGMQTGPFVSPGMFEELIAPYMKERIAYTKQFTDAYFFHHTCGSVFALIPALLDCGVEILNPIQPLARDMEADKLKAAYGDRLTFWGGVDTQQLLPNATPDEVRAEVRRIIAAMKGTGYVLAPAHTLQSDVKPENLLAMFDRV